MQWEPTTSPNALFICIARPFRTDKLLYGIRKFNANTYRPYYRIIYPNGNSDFFVIDVCGGVELEQLAGGYGAHLAYTTRNVLDAQNRCCRNFKTLRVPHHIIMELARYTPYER